MPASLPRARSRLPEAVVSSGVELLKCVCHTEDDRLQVVSELVADLRQPIQRRATAASKAKDRERQIEVSTTAR